MYFTDGDGKRVYAMLRTDYEDDINWTCKDYITDDLNVGDLVLSGCFRVYDLEYAYDDNANEIYNKVKVQYPGEYFVCTFYYDDLETTDDYWSQQIKGMIFYVICALIFLLPSGFGLKHLICKRKQLNAYLDMHATGTIVKD